MSVNKFMNVSELAEELGENQITVEFWLKRFNKWLPYIVEEDKKLYSLEIFNTLVFIAERVNAGILPSKIENALKIKFSSSSDNNVHDKNTQESTIENIEKELLKGDSINLLQSLITSIGSNQERIAKAHERRAAAEERKAVAIEKRAEAEEKKACAMNNIANALQNMKHEVWPGNTENQIKSETARAISLDESYFAEPVNEKSNINNTAPIAPSNSASPDKTYVDEADSIKKDDIDDLSSLIENGDDNKAGDDKDTADASTDIKSMGVPDTPDDLSLLIDNNDEATESPAMPAMDKKAAIPDKKLMESMDDLSLLVDTETVDKKAVYGSKTVGITDHNDLDDLSLLIDTDAVNDPGTSGVTIQNDLDDLSMLIDEQKDENGKGLDDLSILIDDETEQAQGDLNLKPSVSLEENFDQYKSEIINSIIKLKKDGLSVEETTGRLNKAGIKTFSGKNRWGTKTIAKIYKFIERVS